MAEHVREMDAAERERVRRELAELAPRAKPVLYDVLRVLSEDPGQVPIPALEGSEYDGTLEGALRRLAFLVERRWSLSGWSSPAPAVREALDREEWGTIQEAKRHYAQEGVLLALRDTGRHQTVRFGNDAWVLTASTGKVLELAPWDWLIDEGAGDLRPPDHPGPYLFLRWFLQAAKGAAEASALGEPWPELREGGERIPIPIDAVTEGELRAALEEHATVEPDALSKRISEEEAEARQKKAHERLYAKATSRWDAAVIRAFLEVVAEVEPDGLDAAELARRAHQRLRKRLGGKAPSLGAVQRRMSRLKNKGGNDL